MKKNDFLQDAIGLIDEELVMSVGHREHKRRTAAWVRWVAAAACLSLLLSGLMYLLPDKWHGKESGTITVAQNLWQQNNFDAFSLSYRSAGLRKLSAHSGIVRLENTTVTTSSEPTVLETKTISISQDQTFKFERLIAQRYAVYRSETGFVMFYDTVEDRQLNLQERILGDTSGILTQLKETAAVVADEKYPGFLASPVNWQILDLYLTYIANGTLAEHWDEITALIPDTGFLNAMGYEHRAEEEKRDICWNLGWELYVACMGRMDEQMLQQSYVVTILGIDETNGICIIATKAITGSGAQFFVYDIRSDTCSQLTGGTEDLSGILQIDGYTFRFSADGTVATVAYPAAYLDGGNLRGDLTQRFVVDTKNRLVTNYRGENLGVYFLEKGTCHEFQDSFFQVLAPGASELFVSDNNSVLYYKQMEEALAGKTFHASDVVWYNRLKLYNRDTDHWVFHTVGENDQIGKKIVLQGNFVRFAANETVVIMERSGNYYAYSLLDGSEMTQDIQDGMVSMYAHEQLVTVCQDGQLYVTNVFTGQRQTLGRADAYILSSNGAFAFVYCNGDDYVTCYNVASGESCRIAIDSDLRAQLFAREDAVLQMSYNEQENTLLLSYYAQEDVTDRYDTDVDFYDLLSQLQDGHQDEYLATMYPDHPKVITDVTVTEEVMEQFRNSAYRYDHPNGVISWETYYPEGITVYENKSTIFECLGLPEPENYLDVNGTQFVLYEDEDEKLQLTFWKCWLLYDYQDTDAGFSIEYTANGSVYEYRFVNEETS